LKDISENITLLLSSIRMLGISNINKTIPRIFSLILVFEKIINKKEELIIKYLLSSHGINGYVSSIRANTSNEHKYTSKGIYESIESLNNKSDIILFNDNRMNK